GGGLICKCDGDGDCDYKRLGYGRLASLACRLREALFENKKLPRKCWGTYVQESVSKLSAAKVTQAMADEGDEFEDIFGKAGDGRSGSKQAENLNLEDTIVSDIGYKDPDCGPDPFANRALNKYRDVIAMDIINIMRFERKEALANLKMKAKND
ncbi:hypothetical protein LPJ75_005007, partial [Coemansia sp. RSA 2598]